MKIKLTLKKDKAKYHHHHIAGLSISRAPGQQVTYFRETTNFPNDHSSLTLVIKADVAPEQAFVENEALKTLRLDLTSLYLQSNTDQKLPLWKKPSF